MIDSVMQKNAGPTKNNTQYCFKKLKTANIAKIFLPTIRPWLLENDLYDKPINITEKIFNNITTPTEYLLQNFLFQY